MKMKMTLLHDMLIDEWESWEVNWTNQLSSKGDNLQLWWNQRMKF